MNTSLSEDAILEQQSLVNFVVSRMASRLPSHVDLDDLRSSGTLGLLDAAEKFDPSRGASFKTYAEYRVRGAIVDALRAQDWVPRAVREKETRLDEATRNVEQSLGRKANPLEVSTEAGVTVEDMDKTLAHVSCSSTIHFSALLQVNDAEQLMEVTIADENSPNPFTEVLGKESSREVKRALKSLNAKAQQVFRFYYWEDRNMKEIAAAMGLTEGRVSQIHSRALTTLRKRLG